MNEKKNQWLTLLSKPLIRLFLFILSGLFIPAAVFFIYLINPSDNPLVPACSFYHLTGLYCPGCGMTRALHAVLHGRIGEAFSFHPLWPFLVFIVLTVLYCWFCFLLTGKNPFRPMNRFLRKYPAAAWIILAVFFVFWIGRNIPVYPFTLLAP